MFLWRLVAVTLNINIVIISCGCYLMTSYYVVSMVKATKSKEWWWQRFVTLYAAALIRYSQLPVLMGKTGAMSIY